MSGPTNGGPKRDNKTNAGGELTLPQIGQLTELNGKILRGVTNLDADAIADAYIKRAAILSGSNVTGSGTSVGSSKAYRAKWDGIFGKEEKE